MVLFWTLMTALGFTMFGWDIAKKATVNAIFSFVGGTISIFILIGTVVNGVS